MPKANGDGREGREVLPDHPAVADPFAFATRPPGRLPSLTSTEHTKAASLDDVSRPGFTQPTSVQPRSRMTLAKKFPGGAGCAS